MTNHITRSLALASTVTAAAALLTAPAGADAAQSDRRAERDTKRGLDALAGAWRMTRLETGTEGNLQPTPYSGQIIFTRSGNVSVQAMNPDTSAPDTPFTVNGYEAYYGDVAINRATRTARRGVTRGSFAVTVRSAAVRDLIGQDLNRNFTVTRNTLVLTPTDPSEGFRVTYRRF